MLLQSRFMGSVLLVGLIACGVASMSWSQITTTQPSSDFVSFLVKKDEENRNRIRSIRFKTEWLQEYVSKTDAPKAPNKTVSIVRTGNNIRVFTVGEFTDYGQITGGNATTLPAGKVVNREHRALLTGKLFALWDTSTQVAHVYDHLSLEQLSSAVKNLSEMYIRLEVINDIYGADISKPGDMIRDTVQTSYKWAVEKVTTENEVFLCLVGSPPEDANPNFQIFKLYFDPNRDCVLVKETVTNRDGKLIGSTDVEWVAHEDGLLFPTKVRREYYVAKQGGIRRLEDRPVVITTIKFHDVILNQNIEDDEFDVKSLDIPEHAIIIREDVTGRSSNWQFRKGVLVPHSVANSFDKGDSKPQQMPSQGNPVPTQLNNGSHSAPSPYIRSALFWSVIVGVAAVLIIIIVRRLFSASNRDSM